MLYFRSYLISVIRRAFEDNLTQEETLEKLTKFLDGRERIYKCEGCGQLAGMYGDVPFPKEIEDDSEFGHIGKGCMCMSCLCESNRKDHWRPFFELVEDEDDE
jgi:hypothetical protein